MGVIQTRHGSGTQSGPVTLAEPELPVSGDVLVTAQKNYLVYMHREKGVYEKKSVPRPICRIRGREHKTRTDSAALPACMPLAWCRVCNTTTPLHPSPHQLRELGGCAQSVGSQHGVWPVGSREVCRGNRESNNNRSAKYVPLGHVYGGRL